MDEKRKIITPKEFKEYAEKEKEVSQIPIENQEAIKKQYEETKAFSEKIIIGHFMMNEKQKIYKEKYPDKDKQMLEFERKDKQASHEDLYSYRFKDSSED